MKCPLCDIEPNIVKSRNVMIGDKLYRRQTYACRNEHCPNYKKEIGHEDIPLEYEVVEEGESE